MSHARPGPLAGAPVPAQPAGPGGPFPYRLVATDLDGTLLRTDESISPRTRAALGSAVAAGARHVVATGRSVAWTRHILRDLGYEGLAVCGQGAQLYHAGEDRLVTSVTLDRALARAVVTRLEAALGPLGVAANRDGLNGQVVMDERFHTGPGSGFGEDAGGDAGPDAPQRAPERSALFAEPLIKLYLRHPTWNDDELAAAATAEVGEAVGLTVSGEGLVEVLPLGLGKATGLALAARRLGVRAAEAIAFGDMPNDLSMFAWAGHSVAMGGAHPEVKAAADEITEGNDADGIALVLERLLAQGR
ncbi:Cof-type HAD-IIB family hydrolase [Streptomyces sp. 3MP-14]|uniref:Cof-type HAD-IIB family hydrolase n=1 Tax=Streptomyces mimosae TaxID=2586635 RepID=A0A5N6A649_9ACTN|nr:MULTISPECIES: HAD family hydrolase [Streptomyces]KAB8163396.1 Cof-type HAD-IIB family hydrolase [Streptomyces mimosae]KAB8174673.1 Cof-type HAD-IIB family hydrolase [Streptomyces sp. 3MP-14]